MRGCHLRATRKLVLFHLLPYQEEKAVNLLYAAFHTVHAMASAYLTCSTCTLRVKTQEKAVTEPKRAAVPLHAVASEVASALASGAHLLQ